jgi:hypothetical protein
VTLRKRGEVMTIVDLYTVQIIRDEDIYMERDPAVIDALMPEMEENLTDLLPPGYRARIRRWDDNSDEPTQEDNDE